jgi:hypothetical protein
MPTPRSTEPEALNTLVVYSNGAVDVPHWGISLRTIFGAAAQQHDIAKHGRKVNITLRGVYIGTLQLADNRQGKR